MKHTRDLFWILLVKQFYGLNLSLNTNVDNTSLVFPNSTTTIMWNPDTTNFSTKQTLNYTNTGTNNTLYMLNLSEAAEETIDIDVLKKIEYYSNIATAIWRILPPILLGKKQRLARSNYIQ